MQIMCSNNLSLRTCLQVEREKNIKQPITRTKHLLKVMITVKQWVIITLRIMIFDQSAKKLKDKTELELFQIQEKRSENMSLVSRCEQNANYQLGVEPRNKSKTCTQTLIYYFTFCLFTTYLRKK